MSYNRVGQDDSLPPIPTYEEATGPQQERTGLLARGSNHIPSDHNYRFPRVENIRESEDSVREPGASSLIRPEYGHEDDSSEGDSIDGLERDFQEMEVEDLDVEGSRSRLDNRWKGRFGSLRRRMGRWRQLWTPRTPSRPEWTEHLPVPDVRNPWPDVPEQYKRFVPSLPVVARLVGLFCMILLGYALFVFGIIPGSVTMSSGQMFDPESVRIFAQDQVSGGRIRDHLQKITKYPHMAGTKGSEALAEDIGDFMMRTGLTHVEMDQYRIYMNWPKPDGRRIAIIEPPEQAWAANIDEPSPYTDDDPSRASTPVFHGYSRAGNVTGHLVFANYGHEADYTYLRDIGVKMDGAIAIVKYGGLQSDNALKVRSAERWGIKGVLMYSDPANDGSARGRAWPEGPWRPQESVERGTVALSGSVLGDPLTPGWASTESATSISKDGNPGLVNIPSLPLSAHEAASLLKALRGHGKPLADVPTWPGGLDLEWWTGDDTSPVVHLQNDQSEGEKEAIYNVIGTIRGEVDISKQIIVGSHHDSWCFGAADAASGTAIMLEVIEVFNLLRMQGWRPLRTIKFASWDAKEYNLAGSTEFVEDHLTDLRRDGVAYLNIDVGVTGPNFRVRGSPSLQRSLFHAMNRVAVPELFNGTVKDVWDQRGGRVAGLGASGDFAAFQDIAGVSALDIGFEGDSDLRGSCYQTYEWMETFGDPDFNYHRLLAQIWVLVILDLAQEPLLPVRLDDYADSIFQWAHNLQFEVVEKIRKGEVDGDQARIDFTTIGSAADAFKEKAEAFHNWEMAWYSELIGRGGFETTYLEDKRVHHNEQVMRFEKNLLDLGDDDPGNTVNYPGVSFTGFKLDYVRANVLLQIPGRNQLKHTIFAPSLDNSLEEEYFPAVRDAMRKGNWENAQAQLDKVGRILGRAVEQLEP